MRLRNVPGAREVMVENEYVFTEPEGMKGTWHEKCLAMTTRCGLKSAWAREGLFQHLPHKIPILIM